MNLHKKIGATGAIGLGLGLAVLATATLPASASEEFARGGVAANPAAFGV